MMSMITRILSGNSQFTRPTLVGRGEVLQYEINETTPSFVSNVVVQWIIGGVDASQPVDRDTRWRTVKSMTVGSDGAAGVYDGGKAWYRIGIPSDGWTSGAAEVKLIAG